VSRALLAAAILAMVASCSTPIVSPSPSPSRSPTPSATTSTAPSASQTPSPTQTASPSPTPRPVIVTPAGTLPTDNAYVLVQSSGAERVLLLDLAAKKTREIVRFDRPQATNRSVVISSSSDGQTIAMLEKTDGATVLYIVRPATGDLKTLPQQAGVTSPNISPDGKNVALAWTSTDAALNGLWMLPTDGSVGTRIIAEAPGLPGSPPQPRAWSIDGRWLAAFAPGAAGNQILVVDTRAGVTTYDPAKGLSGGDGRVITGIDAAFRDATVFAWTSRASPGTPTVTSYDVVTRTSATVYTVPDTHNIIDVVPRPRTAQLAVRIAPWPVVAANSPNIIVLAERGQPSRALQDFQFLQRMWWSADGGSLYTIVGGDDSVASVADVFGGWGSMRFCLRGGEPPACS